MNGFILPSLSVLFAIGNFFIFPAGAPLGNADETMQTTMAFGLAVSQELNLSLS